MQTFNFDKIARRINIAISRAHNILKCITIIPGIAPRNINKTFIDFPQCTVKKVGIPARDQKLREMEFCC